MQMQQMFFGFYMQSRNRIQMLHLFSNFYMQPENIKYKYNECSSIFIYVVR